VTAGRRGCSAGARCDAESSDAIRDTVSARIATAANAPIASQPTQATMPKSTPKSSIEARPENSRLMPPTALSSQAVVRESAEWRSSARRLRSYVNARSPNPAMAAKSAANFNMGRSASSILRLSLKTTHR